MSLRIKINPSIRFNMGQITSRTAGSFVNFHAIYLDHFIKIHGFVPEAQSYLNNSSCSYKNGIFSRNFLRRMRDEGRELVFRDQTQGELKKEDSRFRNISHPVISTKSLCVPSKVCLPNTANSKPFGERTQLQNKLSNKAVSVSAVNNEKQCSLKPKKSRMMLTSTKSKINLALPLANTNSHHDQVILNRNANEKIGSVDISGDNASNKESTEMNFKPKRNIPQVQNPNKTDRSKESIVGYQPTTMLKGYFLNSPPSIRDFLFNDDPSENYDDENGPLMFKYEFTLFGEKDDYVTLGRVGILDFLQEVNLFHPATSSTLLGAASLCPTEEVDEKSLMFKYLKHLMNSCFGKLEWNGVEIFGIDDPTLRIPVVKHSMEPSELVLDVYGLTEVEVQRSYNSLEITGLDSKGQRKWFRVKGPLTIFVSYEKLDFFCILRLPELNNKVSEQFDGFSDFRQCQN